MKKIYILPLSLILASQAFTEDFLQKTNSTEPLFSQEIAKDLISFANEHELIASSESDDDYFFDEFDDEFDDEDDFISSNDFDDEFEEAFEEPVIAPQKKQTLPLNKAKTVSKENRNVADEQPQASSQVPPTQRPSTPHQTPVKPTSPPQAPNRPATPIRPTQPQNQLPGSSTTPATPKSKKITTPATPAPEKPAVPAPKTPIKPIPPTSVPQAQPQNQLPGSPTKPVKPATSAQTQKQRAPIKYQRQTTQAPSQKSVSLAENGSSSATAKPAPAPTIMSQDSYNAVRPVVKNGWNVWAVGEALCWQAVEDNLVYAYETSTPTLNSSNETDLQTLDFNWDWGFRVGLGYNMPRDGWDIGINWTNITNHAKGSSDFDDGRGSQVWTIADEVLLGTATEASSKWKVKLNQIDLELGREFRMGRYLTFRPKAGLRNTWISQKFDINFATTAASQEARLQNRFWGFGFATGVDTSWELGQGISLYGDAGMSILFGCFKIHQSAEQDASTIWEQHKSFRSTKPILDLGMGFKWRYGFMQDRIMLTLKGGYEYHLYFNQNQFLLSSGGSPIELFNPANGDLGYQGATMSAQLDF